MGLKSRVPDPVLLKWIWGALRTEPMAYAMIDGGQINGAQVIGEHAVNVSPRHCPLVLLSEAPQGCWSLPELALARGAQFK